MTEENQTRSLKILYRVLEFQLREEDLIVRVPHLAASYLCDTKTLSVFEVQPIAT